MKPEKEQEFNEIVWRMNAGDESLKEISFEWFELFAVHVLLVAQVLPQSKVTSLNLSHNIISGAIALADVLAQSQVTSLNLA